MKDLMGKAMWDFYHDNDWENILTETSISELDDLPPEYFFREFSQMNTVEQTALLESRGRVLDVGAGAGSHSLYLQKERGLDVTALDISPRAVEVSRLRGVKKAVCEHFLSFSGEASDTILLLMNGTGIFETLERIPDYLNKISELLTPGGQVLIDSTDILYMYDRDENGEVIISPDFYYGEVDYWVHYKGESEPPITWLYLDFETLRSAAEKCGFNAERIAQEAESYLAKLTKK